MTVPPFVGDRPIAKEQPYDSRVNNAVGPMTMETIRKAQERRRRMPDATANNATALNGEERDQEVKPARAARDALPDLAWTSSARLRRPTSERWASCSCGCL